MVTEARISVFSGCFLILDIFWGFLRKFFFYYYWQQSYDSCFYFNNLQFWYRVFHSPARALLIDISYTVELTVWQRIFDALHGFLSVVCNMSGSARVPLFTIYLLDGYPEVLAFLHLHKIVEGLYFTAVGVCVSVCLCLSVCLSVCQWTKFQLNVCTDLDTVFAE